MGSDSINLILLGVSEISYLTVDPRPNSQVINIKKTEYFETPIVMCIGSLCSINNFQRIFSFIPINFLR